jgi:hypothetical protein
MTQCSILLSDLGYRRSFALLTVGAGVFVSVDYTLVDHHRCRGHYYAHPPKDPWTWDVHLVWTLAFVVSIWLWTVAMFCLDSAIPLPQVINGKNNECESRFLIDNCLVALLCSLPTFP